MLMGTIPQSLFLSFYIVYSRIILGSMPEEERVSSQASKLQKPLIFVSSF